jgi:hypothetical protein
MTKRLFILLLAWAVIALAPACKVTYKGGGNPLGGGPDGGYLGIRGLGHLMADAAGGLVYGAASVIKTTPQGEENLGYRVFSYRTASSVQSPLFRAPLDSPGAGPVVLSPTFDGPPGVRRLPGSVGIVARTGDGSVHWLGDFRSASIFAYSPTSDLKDGSVGPIAFSPWLRSATGSGLIWIGDSAGDSVVVVRARDLSRFTIRLPIVSRAPSRALVEAERKRELGANSGANFFGEAKYSAKYLPERLPYFGSLTPGPQGEIWVQAFATDAAGPVQYVVIDSTGRPKGQVAVPGGSRIREVGLDYVLIVHTNEDDVESVRLHRLDRVRD